MSWCFKHWSERMEKLRVVLAYKREDGAMPWGPVWDTNLAAVSVLKDTSMVYVAWFENYFQRILSFYFSGSAYNYIYSPNAFIYSLRNYYGYGYFKNDVTNPSYATYSHSGYGPTFGSGHDIYLSDNAGYNYNNYFSCSGYNDRYCDNYLWVGSYNFCPSNAEVYYEAFSS